MGWNIVEKDFIAFSGFNDLNLQGLSVDKAGLDLRVAWCSGLELTFTRRLAGVWLKVDMVDFAYFYRQWRVIAL